MNWLPDTFKFSFHFIFDDWINMWKASTSENLRKLETKLAAAKKVKDFPLCKLLVEAVKKQKESDNALENNDTDALERLSAEIEQLDAEVCAISCNWSSAQLTFSSQVAELETKTAGAPTETSNFGFGFSRRKFDQAEVIRLFMSVIALLCLMSL